MFQVSSFGLGADGMREMTREQVVGVIMRKALAYSGMAAMARVHGVHISTLSNMLHGRNRFTPRVLRLLGLGDVRVVEQLQDERAPVPVRSVRPYRPMWRLGDWPSRYPVTRAC